MEFTQADRNFASVHPRVYLWDENFTKYYSQLAHKIGEYAKYDLLGELEIPVTCAVREQDLTVPAIQTYLRNQRAFLFFAMPDVLLSIAYVARREKGKEQYYQRLIDGRRLEEIGSFVGDQRKKGFFANNIILNFNKRLVFRPVRNLGVPRGVQFGTLRLPKEFRSAWVIDGQHRLYGFTHARRRGADLALPVIGFVGMSRTRQAELFLAINGNQKAINPNLIWDLEGEINPTSNYGEISNVVKNLNETGALAGMISMPSSPTRRGAHLKLANICDGIEARGFCQPKTENMSQRQKNPLLRKRSQETLRAVTKSLQEFFHVANRVLRRDWRKRRDGFFCTNNGVNVLLRIYERTIAYYGRKPSRREIARVLKTINKTFSTLYGGKARLGNLRKLTSGEGGRAEVADKFAQVVEQQLSITGFATTTDHGPTLRDRATQIERRLAKFVVQELERVGGEDWVNARLPGDLPKKYKDRARVSNKAIHELLTFGECLPIILNDQNWRDCFASVFGSVFRNKDVFKVKFEEMAEIRNRAVHRPHDLQPRDPQLYDIYEDDLECAMRRKSVRPRQGAGRLRPFSVTPVAPP